MSRYIINSTMYHADTMEVLGHIRTDSEDNAVTAFNKLSIKQYKPCYVHSLDRKRLWLITPITGFNTRVAHITEIKDEKSIHDFFSTIGV